MIRNIFRHGETLVIGDLGLAKSMESTWSFAGTPFYSSPESLGKKDSGHFIDIWYKKKLNYKNYTPKIKLKLF